MGLNQNFSKGRVSSIMIWGLSVGPIHAVSGPKDHIFCVFRGKYLIIIFTIMNQTRPINDQAQLQQNRRGENYNLSIKL